MKQFIKRLALLLALLVLPPSWRRRRSSNPATSRRTRCPWWITSALSRRGSLRADSPVTSFGVTNNGRRRHLHSAPSTSRRQGRQLLCLGSSRQRSRYALVARTTATSPPSRSCSAPTVPASIRPSGSQVSASAYPRSAAPAGNPSACSTITAASSGSTR